MKIDEKNIKIIEILEANAKLSMKSIAKRIKAPVTTVHNRIKKLEEAGIIRQYSIKLDYEKLGKTISAFILITVNQPSVKKISQRDICKKIIVRKEVESANIITGTRDIILKARVESISKLNQFITDFLRNIEGVDKTETMIVLEEVE